MANTIASMLRRRGQTSLLRLDHSDVYFENDRLDQDLSFDINIISREKYRQQLNREAQIEELKRSHSILQRSASSTNFFKVGRIERKTSSRQLNASLNTSLKATSVPVKRPESVFSDSETSTSSADLENKSSAKVSKRMSVRMPRANGAFYDNSDTTSSRQSDVLDTDSEIESISPSVKPRIAAAPKSAHVSTKSRINAMLKSLKLEKIPHHWYTTVVPAKDIHVNYSINDKGTSSKSSKRPHTTKGSFPRHSSSRGATRSAKQDKQPIPPPTPEVTKSSTPPTMKTRRQLLEINQQDIIVDEKILELQRQLEENKVERFTIDKKVKEFLEDLKKSQNKKCSTVI